MYRVPWVRNGTGCTLRWEVADSVCSCAECQCTAYLFIPCVPVPKADVVDEPESRWSWPFSAASRDSPVM